MNARRFLPRLMACALAAVAVTGSGERPTRAQLGFSLLGASEAILSMDFDEAHRKLDGADVSDPSVALQVARLALYEARCDAAAELLSRPDVARTEAGAALGDIARGCARVMAATISERDAARGVEVYYQDEGDRAFTPLLVESVDRARATLERDLGVTWPRPTRVVVVRDLLSLAAMTGLPYASAKTTGTVAVAKWGRVTLLSPRASHHGYAWRDTMAHELTHLAVTRLTVDRAPLWLQEGVAKREEVRWREPGPFDDRPSPEAIALRGMSLHLDTPLDKLGPSIAMLPSADRAAVAFAEVTSFIRFYADTAGEGALPKLLAGIRAHDDAGAAMKELTGTDLPGWDARWRTYLGSHPAEPLPATWSLGAPPPGVQDLRDRARLADLLFARSHPAQALSELEPLPADTWQDPSLRHLRARAFEASGAAGVVEASLGGTKDVAASYGPSWAIRGRFARTHGDGPVADGFFLEAVAQDPLDIESACQTLDAGSSPEAPALKGLCEAARKRGEPSFGGD